MFLCDAITAMSVVIIKGFVLSSRLSGLSYSKPAILQTGEGRKSSSFNLSPFAVKGMPGRRLSYSSLLELVGNHQSTNIATVELPT